MKLTTIHHPNIHPSIIQSVYNNNNNNLMFAWLACKLPDTRISHGLSCEHAVERHFIKENFKWKKNWNLCRVSNINMFFFSSSLGSQNTERLIGSWRIYFIENEYDRPGRVVWIFLWCRFFFLLLSVSFECIILNWSIGHWVVSDWLTDWPEWLL